MFSPADTRILEMFGIELPIIQAPMAGATTPEMVIAVSQAGGLGSLAAARYSSAQLRHALNTIRNQTSRPINLNFFAHTAPPDQSEQKAAWRRCLECYYAEAGLDIDPGIEVDGRAAFDDEACAIVEEFWPEVVSFHFGLPAGSLVDRVKRTGAYIISSATTVAEARWLERHGADAVIAMGAEAGGHRGSFLTQDMSTQVGTIALVPQVVDAVGIPVIAAGGIADCRGVAAALALGAAAVQVGTAYLLTPEAKVHDVHVNALKSEDRQTAITNVFTGRPARGIVNRLMSELGPLSELPPAFPEAGDALAALRSDAEARGCDDFSPLWAGQSFLLARSMSSASLTRMLAAQIPSPHR